MSETLLVKVVATGALVAFLSLVGKLLNRLLGNVSTGAMRKAAAVFAGMAILFLFLLLALNPAKSTNTTIKSLGDVLAFATLGAFGLFMLVGFTLKTRK